MANWFTSILSEFPAQHMALTVALDPDGLLLEEHLLKALYDRGYELIAFEDTITFRYVYESRFHDQSNDSNDLDKPIIIQFKGNNVNLLPYDVVHRHRLISCNLGDIFPNLSYPIVAKLATNCLDLLYQAQNKQPPTNLGDNATKDFILRHVFKIVPELIKDQTDLLRVLLRQHYKNQQLPNIFAERFIEILSKNDTFHQWPLEQIIPSRQSFFKFLQERWIVFLDKLAVKQLQISKQNAASYSLQFKGPIELPFDDEDIRVYMDNLFNEGLLKPIKYKESLEVSGSWVTVGILSDKRTDDKQRLGNLLGKVSISIPDIDATYDDWLRFAYLSAELNSLWHNSKMENEEPLAKTYQDCRNDIDFRFMNWIQNNYQVLHNQPADPPVMVHHIARALVRQREDGIVSKIALIVIDGLAIHQWILIRDILHTQNPALEMVEAAVYGWLPTITSVSRQSIFAGKAPFYFPSSIHTTSKEAALWRKFWANNGVDGDLVEYLKILEDSDIDKVNNLLNQSSPEILGVVVDKVDKIMHGIELGITGMDNQIRQWAEQGFINILFDTLLGHGYDIVLTSDHGNIEAKGFGRPSEGSIADTRGERVRIYNDSSLRLKVEERFPESISWPAIGLPVNFLPLMAPDRRAFIKENQITVTHGGMSLEELIVPMVYITQGNK
jgi:hypothetical protein